MPNNEHSDLFTEVFGRYSDLKRAYRDGQISTDFFHAEIQKLTVQDAFGEHWHLDEAGRWHWYDGSRWVPRDPSRSALPPGIPDEDAADGKKGPKWLRIAVPIVFGLFCICLLAIIGTYVMDRLNLFDSIPAATEIAGGISVDTTQEMIVPTSSTINPTMPAMMVTLSEQQQLVVDDIDWPDSFMIFEIDTLEGARIRHETWVYFTGKTTFTFLDGVFAVEGETDSLPPGYVPTPHHPNQFPLGSSFAEVQALLPGYLLFPVEDEEPPEPGLQFYAGQQLILGFMNDRLFYVDALAFTPEGSE